MLSIQYRHFHPLPVSHVPARLLIIARSIKNSSNYDQTLARLPYVGRTISSHSLFVHEGSCWLPNRGICVSRDKQSLPRGRLRAMRHQARRYTFTAKTVHVRSPPAVTSRPVICDPETTDSSTQLFTHQKFHDRRHDTGLKTSLTRSFISPLVPHPTSTN